MNLPFGRRKTALGGMLPLAEYGSVPLGMLIADAVLCRQRCNPKLELNVSKYMSGFFTFIVGIDQAI
jgi:hypothetical protein